MSTPTIDRWAELRLRTLARHPECYADDRTRGAFASWLAGALASADYLELQTRAGATTAAIARVTVTPPLFATEIEQLLIDYDPDVPDALSFVIERLERLAPSFGPKTYVSLDRSYDALVPVLSSHGLRIDALMLHGAPKPSRAALGDVDAAARFAAHGLRAERLSTAEQVEALEALKASYFGANPQFCWFMANAASRAYERDGLLRDVEVAATEGRYVLLDDDGRTRGYFAADVSRGSAYWGDVAGMDFVLHPELHRSGLGVACYATLLDDMIARGVEVYRGGTSNPAVMHLGRKMGRRLVGWELRFGESPFAPGHFDYPLETTLDIARSPRPDEAARLEDDDVLLADFDRQAIPERLWDHRRHLRVAYLQLERAPLREAIDAMRSGIKALNVSHGLVETPTRGYHESITRAWLQLIDALRRKHGREDTSNAFLDKHTALLDSKALLLFYTRERLLSLEARRGWVEPDVLALPNAG